MYLEHFGFAEFPFTLTPDTEYFLDHNNHRDALNVLQVALRSGEGFIAVTGEIGLGKTLLCRLLLGSLDQRFRTAYLPDPQLSPRGLRIALAEELGVLHRTRWTDEQLMRHIRQRLLDEAAEGRQVVVVIDEAHQLPQRALEAVRLLTNLETEKFKLLQVVLVGQPELDRRLQHPSLRQLRQRIGFRCELKPLDRATSARYIEHRVQVAGCTAAPIFTAAAQRAVYAASRGTPRVVNTLCHKALMVAFGLGARTVTRAHALRAIADSRHLLEPGRGRWLPAWLHPSALGGGRAA